DNLNLLVDVEDNYKVSKVRINYWYEDKIEQSIDLQLIEGMYKGKMKVQNNRYIIYYVIIANDTSGNENITQEKGLELPFTKKDSTSSKSEKFNLFIIYLIIFILAMCTAFAIIYFIKRKKRKQKPQSPIITDVDRQDTLLSLKSSNKLYSDLEPIISAGQQIPKLKDLPPKVGDTSTRQFPQSSIIKPEEQVSVMQTQPIQNLQSKIGPTNVSKTNSTLTSTPSVTQKPIQPTSTQNHFAKSKPNVLTSPHKQITEK
ncbi:hypothetical protein, partial [[Eubacterium] cellulosolvens]